ncbi:MAG TPA: prolipoprotein diacylglyceryl transferase [Candidatus Fraserbacteria bacterium]|nr:prolipoprotein diacylglyceryl transferase [Candidatus Fraserbacteria bacterium]
MIAAIPFEPIRQIMLGPLTVRTFGTLVAIGFAVAYVAARRDIRRHKLDVAAFESLFLWMVLGGLVGARLLYVALNFDLYSNPIDILKVWEGGLVSYGGLLGGATAAWLYIRRKRLAFWLYADRIAPFIFLGWSFGRLGDFISGQLVGVPSDLPWAVQTAGDLPRHPVQIYAALLLFSLFLIVRGLQRYLTRRQLKLPRGSIALAALGFYGIYRFLIEFLRDYPNSEYLFEYRTFSQGVSLGLLLLALAGLWWKYRRQARPRWGA